MPRPSDNTRREILQLTGATTISLSGLPNVVSADDSASVTSLELGDYYETKSGESVTVEEGIVKQSITYLQHADSPGVHARKGAAYVFANVRSTFADRPSETRLNDYRVVVDGRATTVSSHIGPAALYEISRTSEAIQPVFEPGNERMRLEQRISGSVGSTFPKAGQADSVGIGYSDSGQSLDVVWEFGADAVQLFNAQPDFSVVDFQVEDPITPNNQTEIRITAKNKGDAGTFRAIVGTRKTPHPWAVDRFIAKDTQEEISVQIRPMQIMGPIRRNNVAPGDSIQFLVNPAIGSPKSSTATYEGENQ